MSALNKTGTDLGTFRRNDTGNCAQSPMPGPMQGPMSQQASFGSHGYDMHPQTFVRLVGYQTQEAAKR